MAVYGNAKVEDDTFIDTIDVDNDSITLTRNLKTFTPTPTGSDQSLSFKFADAERDIGSSNSKFRTAYINTLDGMAKNIEVGEIGTDADYYISFVDSNNSTRGSEQLYTDGQLKYNPSTDLLTLDKIKPTTIKDSSDSTGNTNYYISANGTGGWEWKQLQFGVSDGGGAGSNVIVDAIGGITIQDEGVNTPPWAVGVITAIDFQGAPVRVEGSTPKTIIQTYQNLSINNASVLIGVTTANVAIGDYVESDAVDGNDDPVLDIGTQITGINASDAVAQRDRLIPSTDSGNFENGDEISFKLNDTTITVNITQSLGEDAVADAIRDAINNTSEPVTAIKVSSPDILVDILADSAGTPFTITNLSYTSTNGIVNHSNITQNVSTLSISNSATISNETFRVFRGGGVGIATVYYDDIEQYATTAESARDTAVTARNDAINFATKPEDQTFTYNSSTYYSALHYAAKAEDSATSASTS